MAECPKCLMHKQWSEMYKKSYQAERAKARRLMDELCAERSRELIWAQTATEYAVAAMKSNVDVLRAGLKNQEPS